MTKLTFTSTVCVINDQVTCDLSGEAVILSLKNGIYYTLNPMGARIWSIIKKRILVSEINKTLLQEFDVPPDQCAKDLLLILGDLEKEGLITVENLPDS